MFKPAVKLTMDNACEMLAAGLQAIAAGESDFDLSEALIVDSSAVAMLLEWQRQARQQGRSLRFGALPPNLRSLIDLYGVAELLLADPHQIPSEGIAEIRHH
ncbi:STAS domain-containing protein [Oxalobacteraceae bacterium CAVE-383]|nr:STAS domain-containing protein [Oxalobacteraceae bacterium CAVE-383]